jgi:hypothetical protein
MGLLLMACGLALAVVGTWSGYRNAREAIAPAVHESDPTRRAIEAARPFHARAGVRRFAKSVAASLAWLALALYGLFLASTGWVLGGLS